MTSFGFGQRTCLGQNLTQDELLVACGGLLWGFNLRKKIDPETGTEIDISTTASNSLLIIKPDPYQMRFVPRSESRRGEIKQNWKRAEERDKLERAAFSKAAAIEPEFII
jgi:hypothetical protein